jgi:hypothetical protein
MVVQPMVALVVVILVAQHDQLPMFQKRQDFASSWRMTLELDLLHSRVTVKRKSNVLQNVGASIPRGCINV